MIRRHFVLRALSMVAVAGSASFRPTLQARTEPCTVQDHEGWLRGILERMETIKPGMTRADLLKVFETEGVPGMPMRTLGLSTASRRTFASRECAYFKVVVEFTPADRPVGFPADESQDIIAKISKPYLHFAASH
jgi:hypothetical protein